MRFRTIVLTSLVSITAATILPAQDFVWIEGSAASNQPAVFGTQGVPADANTPGGRRRGSAWSTDDGKLWVFGGERDSSGSNPGNDLWRYDPSTEQWTWMKGSSSLGASSNHGTQGTGTASTTPGARRYAAQFIGDDGRLWLFGGEATGSARYSDLWAYDPATDIWTWEAGPSVANAGGVYAGPILSPGARQRAAYGKDTQGRFILFGGNGRGASISSGELDDLWRFDPDTLEWELLSASTLVNQSGSYGTVNEPGGRPGGRNGAALWVDDEDRIYVFGGNGRASTSTIGLLNDLWRFDPETSEWTWLGGSNTINATANYGTLRVPAEGNWPGARRTPTWDTDSEGQFMLFGGFGYTASGTGGLADFWRYDPETGLWTWTALVNQQNQPDNRGTKGVPSPCNRVEAKSDAFSFAANPGRDFHIYGSYYGSNASDVVWRYRLPTLSADTLELADLDQANDPDPGFTNDPVVGVTLDFSGGEATYARLAQNNCLTDDQITPLPTDTLTFTLTGADGTMTVHARVGDDDAESYSISASITLDTTPPEVTAEAVSTFDRSPAVTGTVVDANLRDITITIDGNTYTPALDDESWSIAADTITPELDPGAHDVIVTATDRAGNVTNETFIGAITILAPIEGYNWVLH